MRVFLKSILLLLAITGCWLPGAFTALAQVANSAGVNESRSYTRNTFRNLDALIASLEPVKGRKAVFLFTADFDLLAELQRDFQSLAREARKADVTFFTLDAAGRYSTS